MTRSQQEAVEVVAGKDNHQGVKAFASSPLFSATYDIKRRLIMPTKITCKLDENARVKCFACGDDITKTTFAGIIMGKGYFCNNLCCLIEASDYIKDLPPNPTI